MSHILELNIWTASVFLQEIFFFLYERIQPSSPPPPFFFPLSSSYLYFRLPSWTAKLSSYPNIQLNFSSDLRKWTNNNLFPLQDLWKPICKLQQWILEKVNEKIRISVFKIRHEVNEAEIHSVNNKKKKRIEMLLVREPILIIIPNESRFLRKKYCALM